MTATTAMQPSALERSWTGLIRVVVVVAMLVALTLGSFAVGRTTASDSPASTATATPAHTCLYKHNMHVPC